jgi:hypothetical protein
MSVSSHTVLNLALVHRPTGGEPTLAISVLALVERTGSHVASRPWSNAFLSEDLDGKAALGHVGH